MKSRISLVVKMEIFLLKSNQTSGGSRISRWGAPDCRGGGGADLQHRHFSAKTNVKMKELDPIGEEGAHRWHLDPLMPDC